MKAKFKVTETVIAPNAKPVVTTVKANLSAGKAISLRDKLNDAIAKADFDPNRLVSYMVAPA